MGVAGIHANKFDNNVQTAWPWKNTTQIEEKQIKMNSLSVGQCKNMKNGKGKRIGKGKGLLIAATHNT